MVDCSTIKNALVIVDKGYESYNSMAHIQEKVWKFLIQIKDDSYGIKKGLDLPLQASFDVDITLKLTIKQSKETKTLFKGRNHYKFVLSNTTFDYLPVKNKKHEKTQFYELKFRIVRFQITEDTFKTILTNLEAVIAKI